VNLNAPQFVETNLISSRISSSDFSKKITSRRNLTETLCFKIGGEMEVQTNKKRNIPLQNWVDAIARHQIINQAIFEEYVLSIWEKRKDWTSRALERLKPYGITLVEGTLKLYLRELKSGKRDAMGTSAFGNKLFKQFGCRSGKDGMYKQMEILEHMFIPDPVYIGLPANQILYMIGKYGENTFACEIDPDMFRFMFSLKRHFASSIPATIFASEIIGFLEDTPRKFSVYDLDFMRHVEPFMIKRLAGCIARTTMETSVISVASCIGRSTTKKKYRSLMPMMLIKALEKNGCLVGYSYSGSYSDSITPMRYELLVVHRS